MPGRPQNKIVRATFALLLLSLSVLWPGAVLAAPAQQDAGPPDISARAAIVVEYPSGRILFDKTMHDKLAPASTTKILTAILAIEHGNLEQTVTADASDLVGESSMGLEAGEQQTMHNLLYGMLLPSGNDAAMTIARTIGSQDAGGAGKDPVQHFVELMNARIQQLGLQDSHFVNPHGLDAKDHYSSAYDLASFAWYALHFPVFNEVVKTQFYQAPGHPLKNTNEMLTRYDGTDGVKTGWTDAGGLCLVTAATRDGHRLISVVLNAPKWYSDSAAILDYGFSKLAASPTDPNAEVLSVVSRGAASWLLASATSTPPSVPAPAVLSSTTTLRQGGGTSASQGRAAGAGAPEAAPQPVESSGQTVVQGISQSSSGKFQPSTLLWTGVIVLLFAAVGGRLVLSRRGTSINRVPVLAASMASAGPAPAAVEPPAFAEAQPTRPQPAPWTPAPASRQFVTPPSRTVRTLGEMPPAKRHEPNLLITAAESTQLHIERAVALAHEGKQGSSMSEFLLALRRGASIEVKELDKDAELPVTGFLALARAQASMGWYADAVETLEHGSEAFPADRMIQLTLRQMRTH